MKGVKMASDEMLEPSVESCENWALAFGGILLLGILAEFLSPVVPSVLCASWAIPWAMAANALVFIGVAGELRFARMGSRRQGELLQRSKDKLIRAELDRKALQIRLQAVGKLQFDRRIAVGEVNGDGEIRQSRFKALEQFAGTITLIQSVEGREPGVLAGDISHAVQNCGWSPTRIGRTGMGIFEYPPGLIGPGVTIVFMAGPMPRGGVAYEPSPLFHAARALQNLLALDLEPPGGVMFQPQHSDFPAIWRNSSFTLQDNALLVLVGDKPVDATLIGADIHANRVSEGSAT